MAKIDEYELEQRKLDKFLGYALLGVLSAAAVTEMFLSRSSISLPILVVCIFHFARKTMAQERAIEKLQREFQALNEHVTTGSTITACESRLSK